MFKPSDFFHSFGTGVLLADDVLVGFTGSFLKLDISGFEEIRSKLITSSFVDNRDVPLD
jgi:hypothetical protein